jgi:hypothetical protein
MNELVALSGGMVESFRSGNHRIFEHVQFGKFFISLQASGGHYCEPRELLDSIMDYSSYEVAIFEGEKWVLPTLDVRFKHKAWADKFDEPFRPEDPNANSVAGWVTREEVVEMVRDLLEASQPHR